ncbi:MAG: hypothetical protein QXS21_05355 [Thermoproteota archaeon]|nr:hypothetical protein [Candidatus Brockarchaeota archaeon]MBO3767849.1 hypothetical protein [Candidatus Brockarchaeota archaeon]
MKNPEIEVSIRTKVDDENFARILTLSLTPDEEFELEGLTIRTTYEKNVVTTKIACSRGPRSLAETLNEVMLAYEVVLSFMKL